MFEAMLDLAQPMLGAPPQHDLAMVEPLQEDLIKAEDLRDLTA